LDYDSVSALRGWTREGEPIFYPTEPAGEPLYFEHSMQDIDPEWIQRDNEIIAIDMSTDSRDPLIAFNPDTWTVESRTVDIVDEKWDSFEMGTTNPIIHIPFLPEIEFDTPPTHTDFSILLCPTTPDRCHSNPVLYRNGKRKQIY
jgi:hypothetical protein